MRQTPQKVAPER